MSGRYVGYIRVSSVGGRGGDSFRSPDDQRAAIEAYCASRGVEVECLPPDLDESGGTDQRPQLQVAVDGVLAGRWRGIVVFDYSRFFRNNELDAKYTRLIEGAGGEVLSTVEAFPVGAFGTFMKTVNAANNQLYRDQKSEQFRGLQTSLVDAGRWRPPFVPIGYVKGDDGRLVVTEDAAKVREAFAMRARGQSTREIQRRFGWGPHVVSRMLGNRIYLGEVSLGAEVNPAAHEPIIDSRVFAAVQALKGARPKASGDGALLAGLIRCEGCGYVMGRAHRPSPRYACKPNKGSAPCPTPATIAAAGVEDLIEQIARHELGRLSVKRRAKGIDIDAVEVELAEAEAELAAYVSAISVQDVGEIAFRSGARERRERIERARAALAAASIVTPLAAMTGTAADSWDRWTVHQKNLVLRGLLAVIVVRRANRVKMPAINRIRVYPAGAAIGFPGRLPFDDSHDEITRRVFFGKNRRDSAGR